MLRSIGKRGGKRKISLDVAVVIREQNLDRFPRDTSLIASVPQQLVERLEVDREL